MVSLLEPFFPYLASGDYQRTSAPDRDYNCIAWASGDSRNWWWPGEDVEKEYWLTALCEHADPEMGYDQMDNECVQVPSISRKSLASFRRMDRLPKFAAPDWISA